MSEEISDDVQGRDAVFGIAAMSLLEAIILMLRDKGALTPDELDEAFDAAIAAHAHRHHTHSKRTNEDAALLLRRLRSEGNSVRLEP